MFKRHVVILLPTFPLYHQSLFKSIHYDFIDSFGLSISLWIGWNGIYILYTQIKAVFLEGLAIELKAII